MTHFICEVWDTTNPKQGSILNRYFDCNTPKQAITHFGKLPEFKKYMQAGYKIEIRANMITLWDGR